MSCIFGRSFFNFELVCSAIIVTRGSCFGQMFTTIVKATVFISSSWLRRRLTRISPRKNARLKTMTMMRAMTRRIRQSPRASQRPPRRRRRRRSPRSRMTTWMMTLTWRTRSLRMTIQQKTCLGDFKNVRSRPDSKTLSF